MEEKVIVYHGSDHIIKSPTYGFGKNNNDFGLGFYTTNDIELAKEWACPISRNGYVNTYQINLNKLKVLDLRDYDIMNWLAILITNRFVSAKLPIAKKAYDFISKNYKLDYEQYDVIIGYRADDSFFKFTRSFLSNQITIEQLRKIMQIGDLGEQIVIKSKKAFQSLHFIKSEIVDGQKYYIKRTCRDEKARNDFEKILLEESVGSYVSSLIKEKKNNE